MTFSFHYGGLDMASQIIHTQSTNIDMQPLPLDFPFYSLSQPIHVMASHPSPDDNHQSMGGWSERTQGKIKMVA